MDLHYLEVFNTVAELESYKCAAERLHISQPALSTEVHRLEQQLGLRLFDRVGNRVRLSENGRLLRQYTADIFGRVAEMETAMARARSYVGGTLDIGASNTPGTYLLPSVLAAFQKAHPDTRFNVTVGSTSEIAQLVESGALALAVNGGPGPYGAAVAAERLFDDRLVFVASPHSPLAGLTAVGAGQLRSQGFIVHKANSQLYAYYQKAAERLGIPENIVLSLGNIDAIKNAVQAGIGLSLIPAVSVREEVQAGTLAVLPVQAGSLTYPYSLIYSRNRAVCATAACLMQYLRDALAEPGGVL